MVTYYWKGKDGMLYSYQTTADSAVMLRSSKPSDKPGVTKIKPSVAWNPEGYGKPNLFHKRMPSWFKKFNTTLSFRKEVPQDYIKKAEGNQYNFLDHKTGRWRKKKGGWPGQKKRHSLAAKKGHARKKMIRRRR